MSSIIHPIHTVGQKCRPKHQVLVLKCYPKYQKNVQEIKPNSSELSYLLYYASTRRSKLQKVGAFLEKKTASDVWRKKLGNVQVTLQILAAMMDKSPRDLPLYSRSILSILNTVLLSKDINMIEESIPTFETYCKYVESSSLAADQSLTKQYLSIVLQYVDFASQEQLKHWRVAKHLPLVVRWRTIALKAIKSVVGSEALAADSSKQLNLVMPVILENLYLEEDDILASLQHRAQTSEKLDVENAKKRRMSIATVTTVDTVDADPATASGTTADADKLAQDEVRVLAVRCLKQIFAVGTSSQRGQIRLATMLILRFIAARNPPDMRVTSPRPSMVEKGNWATSLIEAVARWTPVQDRFIIVVTSMETLVRSPIVESTLSQQLILATMIDWLLSSSINLIGLSVMDVLLSLIQHTLLLLQLGGRSSKITPHYQHSDAMDLFRDAQQTFNPGFAASDPGRGRGLISKESTPSPIRQDLLQRLQKCIADLATHIYYTDQITDMMTAILSRLKPSLQSEISSTAAAIEDPSAAARAIAASVNLQEDPTTDGFFSFATARVCALRAIKDILMIANHRRTATGSAVESQSRVGIQVWEGTQWLLRDEDRAVRVAYVDAFLTWLKLETNKTDLHLPKDGPRKKTLRKDGQENGEVKLARRTASSASRREARPSRSSFVQLLHLAIYDNALASPENDGDILMLHLLLSNLVERLGVNAARTGLPMITRLQGAALNDGAVDTPKAMVNIASLVHGYLWALTEKFDLETTKVGNEINAEISRRKRFEVWMARIKFPAMAIDHIVLVPGDEKSPQISQDAVGAIKPFLNESDLVDEIAIAYDESLVSPTISPATSPGRVFSVPTLGFGYGYGVTPGPRPSPHDQFPQKIKTEMLVGWSREACIAALEREGSKTASVTDSRTRASSGAKHLVVNGIQQNGTSSGRESPQAHQTDGGVPSPSYGLFGLNSLQKLRRVSTTDGSPVPQSGSSSRESTLKVTELKRALSGYQNGIRNESPLRRTILRRDDSVHSLGSDSMVSFSDADGQDILNGDGAAADESGIATSKLPGDDRRPSTSGSKHSNRSAKLSKRDETAVPSDMSDHRLGEDVPPVPRIPSTLNLPGTYPRDVSPTREPLRIPSDEIVFSKPARNKSLSPHSKRMTSSEYGAGGSVRAGRSMKRGNSRPGSRHHHHQAQPGELAEKFDLGALLAGIHTDSGNVDQGAVQGSDETQSPLEFPMSKPPY